MSIRDLVRRERWDANAAKLRAETDAYCATLAPEPVNGWQAVIDAAWAAAERDLFEKWQLYYGGTLS